VYNKNYFKNFTPNGSKTKVSESDVLAFNKGNHVKELMGTGESKSCKRWRC